MVIDSQPIRDKARQEYHRLAEETEQVREQLEQFRKRDKPNYEQWYYSRFRELISEVRAARQKCEEKEQMLLDIQSEMIFGGADAFEAYERVTERYESAKAVDPRDADEDDEHDEEEEGEPDFEFGKEKGEEQRRGGEEQRRGWEWNGGSREREEDDWRNAGSSKATAKKSVTAHVKELYRALVRRLHPDKQREKMTRQKLERWYQVQAAYEKNDSEQLEILLSLCEIEDEETSERTTVSLVFRVTEEMKTTLRQLKTQLSSCKRDPAWNFSKRKDLTRLETTVRYALEDELEEWQEKLSSMEHQLNRLKGGGMRLSMRRRRAGI